MSPLALVVSFILAFAIGISWMALAVDARITRGRLIRQIPHVAIGHHYDNYRPIGKIMDTTTYTLGLTLGGIAVDAAIGLMVAQSP